MKHFIYILHSKSLDKFYIGETPDVENRLKQHINHHFTKNYTKAAEDWVVVLSKECNSKEEAVFLEKFMKRMKSKKFTLNVIDHPEILHDILKKK